MKRALLAVLAIVVVAAATAVVMKLGVLRRPAPTGPGMPFPPINGQPSPFPPPVALPQAEASALLRSWSYPGAKPVAIKPPLPAAGGPPASQGHEYLLRFTVPGPGIKVRRFYAVRTGVRRDAGAGFSGSPYLASTESYWRQVVNQVMVRSPEISESGEFTRNTRDYWMGAVYAIRPKRKRTLVEVLLIAYGGVQPSPPTGGAQPPTASS